MILTLDFETHAIGERPDGWPPEPVGVALLAEGAEPRYYAWGHPSGNNCTREGGLRAIVEASASADSLLCHNAPFDVAVLEERLGMRWRKGLDDSLVVAFLSDPYAPSLSLKPQAERHLGMPPQERDAVRDWLIEHRVVRASASRQWGAHIADAPGDLVGRYAVGDVVRTRALYDKLRPSVPDGAYRREMAIARMTIDMERAGVYVDVDRLGADVERYGSLLDRMQEWIRCELRAPGLVLSENEALAEAIERRYAVILPTTASGKRSTSKLTVEQHVPDAQMRAALRWEGAVSYNLQTYMRPFLRQAQNDGRVHAQWNAVRGADERRGGGGARTGRFSSSPNLQNLKDADGERRLLESFAEAYACAWEIPSIRSYVVAPRRSVLVGRDYSQIELRVAAHYEDGAILASYRADPDLDLHQWVVDVVKERFGVNLPRRIAKNLGFGVLYGAGAGVIATQAGIPYDEAVELRDVYLRALPSLRELMRATQERGRLGGSIKTLGGRLYRVEPPRVINGERRTFEYKLLNYLVQGSSADLMKAAMLDAQAAGLDVRMTVHDEIVCYADRGAERDVMDALRRAMHENELAKLLDCPVLSSGYVGENWAETEDVTW